MNFELGEKISTESLELEQYGEDEEEDFGEDGFHFVPRSSRKEKEPLDKQQRIKQEKYEKFRQILSERQELRRKNIFLQKKMIEFFKKRKMDHVLKEDPKGLDLDSKYLKRLCELQSLKNVVNSSKLEMTDKVQLLKKETVCLEETVKASEAQFYEKQRKIAHSVTLKGHKKISIRVVNSFLATQAANGTEINRLRLAEIKEKRILADKQNLLKTLNSLEHGLKRADYEILQFQHENTVKIFETRESEAKKCVDKSSRVFHNLNHVQKKAQQAEKGLLNQQTRFEELSSHYLEAKFRLANLQKMRENVKRQQKETEISSGLVTHTSMLFDFESGMDEIAALWRKLEEKNLSKGEGRVSDRCVRFNTPEDILTGVQDEFLK